MSYYLLQNSLRKTSLSWCNTWGIVSGDSWLLDNYARNISLTYTAWKMPLFGVILVHISQNLEWIFSPNAGKCGPNNSEYGYIFLTYTNEDFNHSILISCRSIPSLHHLPIKMWWSCLKIIFYFNVQIPNQVFCWLTHK